MSIRIGIGLGLIPTAARPAATTAPVNVVKPYFEGPLTQGQSADVNPGAWTGLPSPNFTYAIKRGATTVSTDPAYVWTSADVAAGAGALTVAVTATNDIGPTTATSDPVTIVPPLQISGTPSTGVVGAAFTFTPTQSGGHAPLTFALAGTLPSGLTFNPANGRISGTPVASGVASLAIGVVDADGLTATLGPFDLTISSAAIPLPAPFYDDFGSPTGTIHGRARGDAGQWAIQLLSGSNLASLQVVTTGKLSGSIGTTPLNTYGVHTPPTTPAEQWVTTRTALATGQTVTDMLTVPNGGSVSRLALTWSGSGNSGGLSQVPTVAGTAGGGTTILNIKMLAGDVLQRRYYKPGADWLLDVYHNGRKVSEGYNVSSKNVPITFAHGFQGNIAAVSYDDFESGDPTTMGMVTVDCPARVFQKEPNGDLVVNLAGDFSGAAPNTLAYSLFNSSTGAVVTGHSSQPLDDFSTSGGRYTGKTLTIAAADVPSSFYVRIERSGLVGGATAYGYSPFLKGGLVIATNGQSLMQQMWLATSGATVAQPADAWMPDGSTDLGATDMARRSNPLPVNSPIALLGKTILDGVGATPLAIVRGGKGGSTLAERKPGTANHIALREGVLRAGGNFSVMIDSSGTYDSADPDRSAFAANMNTIIDDLEEMVGHSIKVVLCPVGAVWAGTNADYEALRRIQWKMTQDQPTRYFVGPHTTDLQHTDLYHLTSADYAEQARRMGWMFCKMQGVANSDRTGPKLVSVVKNSSSQITVTFDLNGAGGLELVNTAYASDFRGGLRFAAASSFASPLSPTAATINAVAGTTQSITYTFAGTPFASAAAFVSGPYGSQPFNPSNDVTIRADVANKASMLRGTFAGEPSIPVQPYYNAAGDYVTGA